MGVALVACRAPSTSVDEGAKMTSTFIRTSTVASSGSCDIASVQRNSITMFFPSTYPRSRSPPRRASTRFDQVEAAPKPKNPIRKTLAGCCACAASGHAAAPPSSNMNSRRFTASDSRASHRKDSTPRHGRLLHPSTWAVRDDRGHAAENFFQGGSPKQATPFPRQDLLTARNRFRPNFRGWRLDEFSIFARPPHRGASAHARPDERHSVPMDARRPPICLPGDACVVGALERVGDTLYGARVYVKLGRRLAHAHAARQSCSDSLSQLVRDRRPAKSFTFTLGPL